MENRNRADGRHTRCSRRTWPNIGASMAVTGYFRSHHRPVRSPCKCV